MPEVPEHLAPADGLTNYSIRFAGLDVLETGSASLRFEMTDDEGDQIGTLTVIAEPTPAGTVGSLIAAGHRQACDVLRQWLYRLDVLRKAYESK